MAQPSKAVFMIKQYQGEGEIKSEWVRIGVAFTNQDGSLNVLLDALPVQGRLHIRDLKPRKKKDTGIQYLPFIEAA